jgi:diguanylate cyclase (GGDEF)-like protein
MVVAGPRASVLIFSGLLAAVGLGLYAAVVPTLPAPAAPFTIPWPIFALAYFVAEAKVIDVRFRGGTHTFSLTEVPAVIGLFFVDPQWYVIGLLSGAFAALAISRQPLPKLCFNLSQFLVGAVASLAVFYAIAGLARPVGPPEPLDWLAAFAAMLVLSAISALAIASVVTLSRREQQFSRVPEALQVGSLFAVTNTALALLVVEIVWVQPLSVWLVAVPLVTLFVAYRAYLSERQKHESLELLYQSSQIFQRSPALDTAILALLEHARAMFQTERAEMILADGDDGVPLRTAAGPGGHRETMVPAPERARIMRRLETEASPFILDEGEQARPSERLFRYAMVSPLRGESGVIGALLVADRQDENDAFTPDQLRMLETIANQAAVALENGQLEQSLDELSRLKDELRHQAFHDSLTGLANRALFVQLLDERLTAHTAVVEYPGPAGSRSVEVASSQRPPVVLFLDLDDFKVVNDSLGHGAGDRLLRGVAERIQAAVRDHDLAARLGGDEFAVMLADGPDLKGARLIADRIAASLQLPFELGERDVTIGASIGLAVGQVGQDAQDLLRNADVAMYAAKAKGKRQLAVWSHEMHEVVLERHTLTSALARAIETDDVHVAYQPLVALESRQVIGFEALARWDHAERGAMRPEIFIRLAEDSGTIKALGRSVLARACEQAVRWSTRPGSEALLLSVNLSPHQVHDPDFADDVLAVLADTGLPPGNLLLEMTETAMFSDIDATVGKLQALRGRGVRIAVDDFGTGYSSLSWLRQFPVDVLKLARDFVVDGGAGEDDWAFAHAIVMLGRTLGLKIIAEGIETAGQAERLQALGCDYGQGYYFGRPVPPELAGETPSVAPATSGNGSAAAGSNVAPLFEGARAPAWLG